MRITQSLSQSERALSVLTPNTFKALRARFFGLILPADARINNYNIDYDNINSVINGSNNNHITDNDYNNSNNNISDNNDVDNDNYDVKKTAELCLMQMTSTSILTLASAALFVHSKLISLSQNTIFLV